LTSFRKPNSIRFSPGDGGAITVRLTNQFKLVLVDNLGPGNSGATPSMNILLWQMCHTTLVQIKKA